MKIEIEDGWIFFNNYNNNLVIHLQQLQVPMTNLRYFRAQTPLCYLYEVILAHTAMLKTNGTVTIQCLDDCVLVDVMVKARTRLCK